MCATQAQPSPEKMCAHAYGLVWDDAASALKIRHCLQAGREAALGSFGSEDGTDGKPGPIESRADCVFTCGAMGQMQYNDMVVIETGGAAMLPMLKQKVTVQQGGVVHVQSSELVPGSTAEVIIIPDRGVLPALKLADLLGSAAGGFVSPEEVDAFVRRERDAWLA